MNSWWDIVTHEKYIEDKIVPRRLRWDVTINDGLLDEESINEWHSFFNGKGPEVLQLLIKRKHRKIEKIDEQISELKEKLERERVARIYHSIEPIE